MSSSVHCFVKLLRLFLTPRSKLSGTKANKQNEVVTRTAALEQSAAGPTTLQNEVPAVPAVPTDPTDQPLTESSKTLPADNIPRLVIRKSTMDIASSNNKDGVQPPLHATQSPTSNAADMSPISLMTSQHSRPNSSRSSSENSQAGDKAPTPAVLLKEGLDNARVECALHSHSFIVPRDVQDNLITEPTIMKVIQANNSNISEDEAKE